MSKIRIPGMVGHSGSRKVFLGIAHAELLYRISKADILDEDSGAGYQRRFNQRHSLEFRQFIQKPGATTIPLAFNLRARADQAWKIVEATKHATLIVDDQYSDILYQVDGQHRLGHLMDIDVPLAFMSFIELEQAQEMEVFSTINAKAKGLSTSLLDYHESQLAEDLQKEKPELYIALRLHEDSRSPWHKQLDLGGNSTSGLQRKASLRTMQKGVRRFLKQTAVLEWQSVPYAYRVVREFWNAVSIVLSEEWSQPRRHFLTKGIGVYALTSIAADLFMENQDIDGSDSSIRAYFSAALVDFAQDFDWSSNGPLKGLGGESGATEAVSMLRLARKRQMMKVLSGGK